MIRKNNGDLSGLLNYAGKHLGVDPERLKEDMQKGDLRNLNIPESEKRQIGEILNNPKALNEILNNPDLKKLIDSLTKGGR